MKLNEDRGIKTGAWLVNEILREEDIDYIGEATYKNLSDLLATMAVQGKATGSTPDVVVGGLLLEWDSDLTSNLQAGMAVSFSGYYFDSDDVWGFNASAGDVFSVVVADDQEVVVGAGDGSNPRIDTVEIRPTRTAYHSESRQFKDPVTGLITSAAMNTRIEYTVEVQILAGTPAGSPTAPSKTAGWIKIAEVYVAQSAAAINQDDIEDVRESDHWTAEASATTYPVVLGVLTLRPNINIGTVQALGKPTTVSIGAFRGYSMPIYSADNEELFFSENVPGRWDGVSDITVNILVALAAAETPGETFKFQFSWNQAGETDVVPTSTHDVTDEIAVVDETQYATYMLTFVIDYNIDGGDVVATHDDLVGRLRRIASGGDEVDGEVIVIAWHTHYNIDKTYKSHD